jgi:chemotaxis protein MotB
MSEIGKASRKKAFTKTKAIVHHQDDGEGNWLVSYADMMTLLFGFFVMISAFSTPNAGKFEKMKKETAQAMGAKYTNPYTEMNSSVKTFLKDFNLEENEVSLEETLNGVTITSKGTLFFDSGSAELKPKALELVNSC